jgi:hypothetical protein
LIYVELRRSSLSVSGEGQIDLAEAAVADDGSFLFGAVPPGTYTMFVRAKGSIIFSRPPLMTVDVASGNDFLNLTLNAEPILYGRVTVDDGSPLPSDAEGATTATVELASGLPLLDVEIFPATVQANGSFALRDPLAGLSPSFYNIRKKGSNRQRWRCRKVVIFDSLTRSNIPIHECFSHATLFQRSATPHADDPLSMRSPKPSFCAGK